MSQLILINKETGELGLGIKIDFHDKFESTNEMCKMEGYSIGFRPVQHDGWLLFSGDNEAEGPWLYMKAEAVDSRVEIYGEL